MAATVKSISTYGSSGLVVDIECHLSNNLPIIVIVGYANKAVNEARDRLRGAFATSHLQLPRKRVTINLAPADIPKGDSGFDLAIAMSVLLASTQLKPLTDTNTAFIGELGLDGRLRAVRGIIGKLLVGREHGLTTFYIPAANLAQAQLVPGITLVPVSSLGQLYEHLVGVEPVTLVQTNAGLLGTAAPPADSEINLSDIVGQDQAKRALEIAAAGGHNILLNGPPGTGKSMLAKALASILPPLSQEEVLEVTHLHSLAGHDYEHIVRERPFRSPHHSASTISIIGGSAGLRPGEISLSHRGVLFFDEFPEFSRPTLEALRQPLEDRRITVARSVGSADFPANFILVATANPCPCGYYGTDSGTCTCLAPARARYNQKLSGPIIDRIDLFCHVDSVEHSALLADTSGHPTDTGTPARVKKARVVQLKRFTTSTTLNADMSNSQLKQHAKLGPGTKAALDRAAGTYNMSARAYMRTIKVARTIADLAGSVHINTNHISEALMYRHNQ
ncbi:MAG: Mg chelatase, subunit ChlI [Candidatus Saccharibacteria bacterium]|nr:Mg chelatase, subunit ChlI [Candidatus Saccharibacteria bacterium]